MNYTLFLDLDGVLADFENGVLLATGRETGTMSEKVMWPILARTKGFYEKLHWMSDGKFLWDFCTKYNPVIITGLPLGNWAEPQKRAWCHRELGKDVQVVACMTREKPQKAWELTPEDHIAVLVDDRIKIKEQWEAMGGIFVFHTSAESSINQLKALGF